MDCKKKKDMLTAGTIVLLVMAYRRLAGTFKLSSLSQ